MEKTILDFDIEQIANSGQCFRITRKDAITWKVVAFKKELYITKLSERDYAFNCDEKEFNEIWYGYFDLQRDYKKVKENIKRINDPYLTAAVNYGFGLRILQQDPWESIVSFIISQRNNIPRIIKIIDRLCEPYDGFFPSPEDLFVYTEIDFRNLGLGYRAMYLVEITKAVINKKLEIEKIKNMNTKDSIEYLKNFIGIGDKVANCIALFGFSKIDAFPIDTWINRIISAHYNGHLDIDRFKEYAGIVQQYMFFYQRSL
ncbi:MAG: hypothetical protein LBI95_03655 [Holosporales bacterium]|jgi:N-glycosylase/DNA lyase|nr:hypothetical protein [Holosporales bacterium]